ncbi:hypothetical protein [Shewanella donghaensis]|uniref:hypothetical protein n=1 Tax=Shewanella donghaensis TaxID=238836 RepID=UPI001D0501D2|nr:hypothetical protein [Shewanella donghaensis]
MKSGELRYSQLNLNPQGIGSTTPQAVHFNNEETPLIRTGVSLIKIDNVECLYFVETNTTYFKPTTLYRAQWKNNKLIDKQKLSLPIPIAASSDTKWYLLNSGKIAMVYRSKPYSGCCQLLFSTSDDGIHFKSPIDIGSGGAMPAMATFSSNDIIYTFQTRFVSEKTSTDGQALSVMKTHFRLSSDNGIHWSKAYPITSRVEAVHDAKPIQRNDGNVDVYYSSVDSTENDSFTLWRRCVSPAGRLGDEELVINQNVGNIAKVSVHRLTDTSLLITFVEQGQVYSEGDHNLHTAWVVKDAVCNLN